MQVALSSTVARQQPRGVLRSPGRSPSAGRLPTVAGAGSPVLAGVLGDGAAAGARLQRGFFDDLLGAAGPGLVGAASSLVSGDGSGALGQLRSTGAQLVPGLAERGASALGGAVGGPVGQAIGSLGGSLGAGLGGLVSGESTPQQAAGGVLGAAQPSLLALLSSLLRG